MEVMDKKEKTIFSYYKDKIEQFAFDEYDILGFLIFVRRHIKCRCDVRKQIYKNPYPCINEFCDLIAHRERNQGKAMDAVKGGIDNQYQTKEDSDKLKGYHGIYPQDWKKEWEKFFSEFKIDYSDKTILEITLCIYSLAQYTRYQLGENHKYSAEIYLFQETDGNLTLVTKEREKESPYVNFARYGEYDFKYNFPDGYIDEEVETYRDSNKKLHLKTKSGTVLI